MHSDSKMSNSQQTANKQPTNSQQTANKQPTNSQQTANKQPTNSQQTANKQPTNSQQTANKQPTNSQQTANKQPTNSQQTAFEYNELCFSFTGELQRTSVQATSKGTSFTSPSSSSSRSSITCERINNKSRCFHQMLATTNCSTYHCHCDYIANNTDNLFKLLGINNCYFNDSNTALKYFCDFHLEKQNYKHTKKYSIGRNYKKRRYIHELCQHTSLHPRSPHRTCLHSITVGHWDNCYPLSRSDEIKRVRSLVTSAID